MRNAPVAAFLLAAAGLITPVSTAAAQDTITAPLSSRQEPFQADSGFVANEGGAPAVVYATTVSAPGAAWLRLNFEQVQLSGEPDRGDGSYLRITSAFDGAVQYLHADHVAQWRNTSAYFNGDTVFVELIAAPGTGPNRLVMKEVTAGVTDGSNRSICGPTDDRQLSTDPRAARALPVGCTAWLFDDCNRCFLTAGHCSGGSDVIQFNVPLSTSSGGLVHPPPEDQYATDQASVQSNGGLGTGNDWAYFGVFPNSNTGLTPDEAQGDYYRMVVPPPLAGQFIRITGYGTVSSPVSPTWNQVQKTHLGPFFSLTGDRLQYQTDTTGGNSGSPVILESTGQAIGIHTHGGCSGSSGNSGTATTHAALQSALANPQGVCVCVGLEFEFPGGLPELVDPDGGTTVRVQVLPSTANTPQPGTGEFHYDAGGGFVSVPMTVVSDNVYDAVFPALPCRTPVRYYFSAESTAGDTYTDPGRAPDEAHVVRAATTIITTASYDFQSADGWTVTNTGVSTGAWTRAVPADPRGPSSDFDGSGACYVTGNAANEDLDGGPTRLLSPVFDLSAAGDPLLSYARYFTNTSADEDRLTVEISADGGTTWQLIESVPHTTGWVLRTVRIRDHITPGAAVRVRFSAADNPNDTVTEAAIDRFRIEDFECEPDCPADFDGSGDLTLADFTAFRNAYVAGDLAADIDGDGLLTLADFVAFRNAYTAGCP